MNRVVLHIDRLVLRGFDPADRDGIATGLKDELGRLLATPEATRRLITYGGIQRLQAGTVRLGTGTPATAVGEQAGQRSVSGILKGCVP